MRSKTLSPALQLKRNAPFYLHLLFSQSSPYGEYPSSGVSAAGFGGLRSKTLSPALHLKRNASFYLHFPFSQSLPYGEYPATFNLLEAARELVFEKCSAGYRNTPKEFSSCLRTPRTSFVRAQARNSVFENVRKPLFYDFL